MKKTLFALMAFALVCAISFSACKKEEETKKPDPDPTEKTKFELITQAKGWELTQAICSPDYQLNDSSWCNFDLLSGGFFWDCEKDDVYKFLENKSFIREFGVDKCTGETGTNENMGVWAFLENEEHVRFYMTAYYDEDNAKYMERVGIIKELTETTLKLEVLIDETDEPAPTKGEVFPYKGTFILTFKVKN